jgi:hypothetical protein
MIKKPISARGIFLLSLILVFTLSAFSPLPQEPTEGTILDKILVIVTGFAALVGVAALGAALVAIARALGWVSSDEQAGKILAGYNLIAFITLVLFGVFRPDLSLDFLDSTAAKLASIALFVLGFIVQMITPAPVLKLAYQAAVPGARALGADVQRRAHFVELGVVDLPSENYSANYPEKHDKPKR